MEVLYWDRTGFCVWAKRLEQGRFVSNWAQVRTRQMDWMGPQLLLERYRAGTLQAPFPTARKRRATCMNAGLYFGKICTYARAALFNRSDPCRGRPVGARARRRTGPGA